MHLDTQPPSYDEFIKWGQAYSSYQWMTGDEYVKTATALAASLGTTMSIGAFATAAGTIGVAIRAAIISEQALSTLTAGAAEAISGIAGLIGIGVSMTLIVVAAIAAIVIADHQPSHRCRIAWEAGLGYFPRRHHTARPGDNNRQCRWRKTIFSFFVGATLPGPFNQTCDNTDPTRGIIVIKGLFTISGHPAVFESQPHPLASTTDPRFVIQENGTTNQTVSPAITLTDAEGTTTTYG